ncbi:MAG TPA: riboflavin synthase, partial [Alicycliphilus sp.]|nr:riboflavin synthase [Alicycliphilus sp.]HRN64897.1 riboflavin synthase [Alicycliphilus sp.]
MFTGIVQATAVIAAIEDRAGLRTFSIEFPPGFCADLAIGASVATDGVCLTVTE